MRFLSFFLFFLGIHLLSSCGGGGSSDMAKTLIWQDSTNTQSLWKGSSSNSNKVAHLNSENDVITDELSNRLLTQDIKGFNIIEQQTMSDGTKYAVVQLLFDDGFIHDVLGRFSGDFGSGTFTNSSGAHMFSMAAGDKLSSAPAGSFQYTGFALSQFVYDGEFYVESGSFTLDADFSSSTAQLSTDHGGSKYVHSNLQINNYTGEISGKNGSFVILTEDGSRTLENRSLDFAGHFHGYQAINVTGMALGEHDVFKEAAEVSIVGSR